MAENVQSAFAFSMGPLAKTNHTDQQEFADDIARALIGQQIEPPKAEDGQAGKDGTLVTQTTREFAVEDESTFIDTGVTLTGSIVQLTNSGPSGELPTVGISAIKGTTVHFTGPVPTANYKVVVTTFTLSNPT